jgi:oligopeptide/dipeptide ABC transporter ATP-binding protein
MAMASGARLLIADEATTSLDVTIQDEIVRLLERLVRETRISVIFISHDLGLVARLCDRVAVFYAGQVVETGAAGTLLTQPLHPYTQGLLRCVPSLEQTGTIARGIPGAPPLPGTWPHGCRFEARCEFAADGCGTPQVLAEHGSGHEARCWRAGALRRERPA